MRKRDIRGLTVVVTGGARGIGAATAGLLAARGATVALGDLDTELVREVADRIGHGAVGAHLDVSDPGSWQRFLDEVGEVGPIDVLINNAGIMPLGPVLEEPYAVARAIIDVNVHGIINGTKVVAPGMADRGRGHIVNVASALGRIAVADGATYSASKFAAVGFSEATRAELEPLGIDVSVVLPTVVDTELAAGVSAARGFQAVTVEDVAEVVVAAIRKPVPELWVPRWVQAMNRTTGLLPRALQEAVGRALGADRVLATADHGARAAYEARVRPPAG